MAVIKGFFRFFIFLVIAAALIFGAVKLVKHKQAELAKAPRYAVRPLPVKAASAVAGDLHVTLDYLAVVEPVRRAAVSARITSTVEEILVDEGDEVRKGDVLVRLDAREISSGVAAVEARIAATGADLQANDALVDSLAASLAYWKREAARDKALAGKKDIPASQAEATADKASEYSGRLEAAKKKSAALEASIRSLEESKAEFQARLSYCTIESPYDGVVARRDVDPGDLASPGRTLMVVEDLGELKLSFDIPQQDLSVTGEGLAVEFSAGGGTRKAVLSHLYPSLDPSRMLRAEVNLPGGLAEGLSIGEYVPLKMIVKEMKGVTLVPSSSVVEGPGGNPYVFLIRGRVLEAKEVVILGRGDEKTALKGVRPGDRVVTSTFLGWASLSAGNEVEVME